MKNPHNVLAIDGAFSLQINNELKSIYDRHCQCSCDGAEWVTLQRKGPGLNPDLRMNLMYSDYESASKGLLRGCVEHQNCAWWVKSSTRPDNPGARNLLIRLWDCVFNWMEHIVSVLSAEHLKWRPGRLELELEFPGIETWQIEDTAKLTGTPADLSFHFEPATATARLIFIQKFLPKFYRADNLAEREIVSAIVRCSAGIARVEVPESELQRIVACVTKNQDSRFFHIVSSKTLESALGGPEHATPAFIPLEEISRVHIGLAHLAYNDPPGRITIQSEAQVFLDKIVANLQGSLVNRLKKFNILPIVSHSFSQLDELSRDRTRWSLSTRSLFALEEGATWLQDRLRTESGRLARAEIANRVLIETAVYSHEPGATEIVSQTEHASLLAHIAVMIELANHRDAIAGGFVAADLKIHPNGMIEFDDSFQREVFQPYLTSRVDDRIRWDAETYDTNFEPPVTEPTPSDEVSPQAGAFERAFLEEFGFSYGKITSIIDYFYNTAVSQGNGGGTLDFRAFHYLLKHEIGLTDPQIDTFVERFVLPIRPGWNKNLPEGCDANDVLPWRYFRGLSVLVRPFVEVARSPRRFAISAPHLHRWRHYLTHSILNGYLPEKLFRSTAMKSYLGSIADKRGHDFTEELAERLAKFLPNQKVEIKMATLGAPSNPDMGDIDLLTWEPTSGAVFVIECKRLKAALTVRQVIQQLEEFRGNPIEMDSLAKHQRRVEWLRNNPAKLSQITGISESEIQWMPLLVTKGRVPMSFLDAIEFPKEQIVPDQQIEQYISTLVDNKRHSKM